MNRPINNVDVRAYIVYTRHYKLAFLGWNNSSHKYVHFICTMHITIVQYIHTRPLASLHHFIGNYCVYIPWDWWDVGAVWIDISGNTWGRSPSGWVWPEALHFPLFSAALWLIFVLVGGWIWMSEKTWQCCVAVTHNTSGVTLHLYNSLRIIAKSLPPQQVSLECVFPLKKVI